MDSANDFAPIRPNGSQIDISEEKIVITYFNIEDEEGKELAAVEIKPGYLLSFVVQLVNAAEEYEKKFGKSIGLSELAEKETAGEQNE